MLTKEAKTYQKLFDKYRKKLEEAHACLVEAQNYASYHQKEIPEGFAECTALQIMQRVLKAL